MSTKSLSRLVVLLPTPVIYLGHILAFFRIYVLIRSLEPIAFNEFTSSYALASIIAAVFSFGDNEKIIMLRNSVYAGTNIKRRIIIKLLIMLLSLLVAIIIPSSSILISNYLIILFFASSQYLANLFLAFTQLKCNLLWYAASYLSRQLISFICLFPIILIPNKFETSSSLLLSLAVIELGFLVLFICICLLKYRSLRSLKSLGAMFRAREALDTQDFSSSGRFSYGISSLLRSNAIALQSYIVYLVTGEYIYNIFASILYLFSFSVLLFVPLKSYLYHNVSFARVNNDYRYLISAFKIFFIVSTSGIILLVSTMKSYSFSSYCLENSKSTLDSLGCLPHEFVVSAAILALIFGMAGSFESSFLLILKKKKYLTYSIMSFFSIGVIPPLLLINLSATDILSILLILVCMVFLMIVTTSTFYLYIRGRLHNAEVLK